MIVQYAEHRVGTKDPAALAMAANKETTPQGAVSMLSAATWGVAKTVQIAAKDAAVAAEDARNIDGYIETLRQEMIQPMGTKLNIMESKFTKLEVENAELKASNAAQARRIEDLEAIVKMIAVRTGIAMEDVSHSNFILSSFSLRSLTTCSLQLSLN